jgi:hypothetical protein
LEFGLIPDPSACAQLMRLKVQIENGNCKIIMFRRIAGRPVADAGAGSFKLIRKNGAGRAAAAGVNLPHPKQSHLSPNKLRPSRVISVNTMSFGPAAGKI